MSAQGALRLLHAHSPRASQQNGPGLTAAAPCNPTQTLQTRLVSFPRRPEAARTPSASCLVPTCYWASRSPLRRRESSHTPANGFGSTPLARVELWGGSAHGRQVLMIATIKHELKRYQETTPDPFLASARPVRFCHVTRQRCILARPAWSYARDRAVWPSAPLAGSAAPALPA